ncbi:MAG: right-handed parallel beta-helix repeat-containing protein [Acidimicrobiales bacterium]|nr:right-handed parallel beta-helix repeat-containing protein [Acidimicrobiales bacterium]
MAKPPAADPGDGRDAGGLTRRRALGVGLGAGAGAWALGSGTAAAEAASSTTFDPTGLQVVTAGTVQDALEQVDERLEGTIGGPGIINVRDYGAVGDGVTNDMAAVIDALIVDKSSSNPFDWVPRFDPAVGGILYFPPGVYYFTGIIIVWFSGLRIMGAGAGRTTLLFKQTGYSGPIDYAPKIWFADPRGDRRVRDQSISDLTVTTDLLLDTAPSRDAGESPLQFWQADRIEIARVEVVDSPAFGISITDATDCVVKDCHVHDIHIDGIHLKGVTRGLVHGCLVDHTGDDAIAVSGGSQADHESLLSSQVVVSSNVVSRSGSRGICVFGADGVVVSDNTVKDTHQAGIGILPDRNNGNTRHVVIRGNHIDGVGLYGEDTDVLWGAGIPAAISVGSPFDSDTPDQTVDDVLVEGNLVNDCRNGFVLIERASDVKVAGNQFYGPITVAQPAPGSHQQAGTGSGQILVPSPPYSGGGTPVYPAVRVRRAKRVRIDNNLVRPASNERAFLVEGPTAAEVVRARVSDNSIDRGTSPPLGTGGVDEIAIGPAGVVAYQGGNDVNGLAIAPASTPA